MLKTPCTRVVSDFLIFQQREKPSAQLRWFLSTTAKRSQSNSAKNAPADKESPPLLFPEGGGKKKPVLKVKKGFFAKFFPSFDGDHPEEGFIISAGLPNDRGVYEDPTMSVEEHLEFMKNTPRFYREEFTKLYKECTEDPPLADRRNFYNNYGMYRTINEVKQGETRVEYDFASDEAMEKWEWGSDSDWSMGYSKCDFYKSDRNTAIFEGTLSTRLVKDGRAQKTGWCSIKSKDRRAFNFRRHYWDWDGFTHVIIKCRGDGRTYKIQLHQPGRYDISWLVAYAYPFHTHGGPYWQYEKIPFSRFFKTFAGRVQDLQQPLIPKATSSFGITLMDRIDGPFKLEIDFIGVTADHSHREKFAYETYNQFPSELF